MVTLTNNLLSILTVAAQVIIVILIVSLITRRKNILNFFIKHSFLFSFIIALTATAGSLFYSEIAHYEPCKLCWFQRIFMYPQTIILFMALKRKDGNIRLYILAMSVIGALIAGYHYLLQLGVFHGDCAAVGYSVSCSQRFVLQFGYLTIPLMALTAFVLISILMGIQRKKVIKLVRR